MRKLIATITHGEEAAALARYSHPTFRNYAERIEADFLVLSGPSSLGRSPKFLKFSLADYLDNYDRILFLDTDILVTPWAEDVFAVVPLNTFGATYIDKISPDHSRLIRHGTIDREMTLIQELFSDIGWNEGYFNSGVLVFDQSHRSVFEEGTGLIDKWNACPDRCFFDQTILNYVIKKIGSSTQDLGCQYNHTRPFNGTSHRFGSSFIHYAGWTGHRRGNRMSQMKQDSRLVAHPGLCQVLTRNRILSRVFDKF